MANSQVQDLNWLVSAAPNIPKLRKVAMKECSITRVPNMDQFKNLEELYLFGNPINNVDGILESSQISKMVCL